MELNKTDQIKHKKILVETMKAFIAFCDKNNLKYYACAGTCLGAIRHNGIIPWDDDVDVLMPREDYFKFVSLNQKLYNSDYEIVSQGTPGYYLPFAKFVNKNTTIVETRDYPFVIGVFIDIFPLDLVGDSLEAQSIFEKRKVIFGKYSMAIKNYYLSNVFELLLRCRIRTFVKACFYSIFGRKLASNFLKKILLLEKQMLCQQGDKCICYCGFYGFKKELCDRTWFGNGIEVPFEDFSIRVPQNYDAYLTHMYGDYMTPPPIEKQVTHHNLYFIDLNKKWDIKDVMKLKLGKQKLKEYKYE